MRLIKGNHKTWRNKEYLPFHVNNCVASYQIYSFLGYRSGSNTKEVKIYINEEIVSLTPPTRRLPTCRWLVW